MIRDPFLFDLVQQELIHKYGLNTVRYGGLKAYTTIEPEPQERAQEAVDSCGVCDSEGGPAAALASVDPATARSPPWPPPPGAPKKLIGYAWQAHREPAPLQDLCPHDRDQAGRRPYSTYYDAPRRRPWTCWGAAPGPLKTPSRARNGVARLRHRALVNVVFASSTSTLAPKT